MISTTSNSECKGDCPPPLMRREPARRLSANKKESQYISPIGITLIKHFEGFSAMPYRDAAGFWTVGYGHLLTRQTGIDLEDLPMRTGLYFPITKQKSEALLLDDIHISENAIRSLIQAPLTQPQFDALASWTFNLGGSALKRSTLRMKLNRGEYASIPGEIQRWVYAGGQKLPGLIRRREAEANLFQQ